jgi:hypothetical protein
MQSPLSIHRIAGGSGRLARQFIQLPYALYRNTPQWVPGFRLDTRRLLSRKDPFFAHSDAAFFLALQGPRAVGRIAALENIRYNKHLGKRQARFALFESADDDAVADRLFEAVQEWAGNRNLDSLRGPLGFTGLTGDGLLVHGHEHRAAMTMMGYHFPYYQRLVERQGFARHRDLYSAYLDAVEFVLPPRVERIARIALKRGRLTVPEFRKKSELISIAGDIGRVYNESFSDHGDHLPLSDPEIQELVKSLRLVSDPKLIKIIYFDGEIAGFLFTFPDLSDALQRAGGRLNPLTILSLLRESKRTRRLVINGMGLAPRFRRTGANALLYHELARATKDMGYVGADLVQIMETTELMLSDIEALGGKIYKTHRIYTKAL